MHKKLASDLTSLAHSILQMKNKDDVFALKEKAHEVYEKLALLAYVEEYINTTPNATTTKDELIASISEAEATKSKDEITANETTPQTTEITDIEEKAVSVGIPIAEETTTVIEKTLKVVKDEPFTDMETEKYINDIINAKPEDVISLDTIHNESVDKDIIKKEAVNEVVDNETIEQPFDELEDILFGDPSIKSEADFIENLKTPILEEEIIETKTPEPIVEETITSEEKPTIPTLEEELKDTISVDIMANLFEKVEPKRTLNDRLQNSIQIDLNDRIAFVKNLFEGDQKDFNRVISQLNTIKTEKEAKQFILKMVKPDYDWSTKEHYETRLLEIIERRFA